MAPRLHGSYSSLGLCCEGPRFTSIQEDGCDKGAHQLYHLAKHSERGKKTGQTEEEVGRQHQGMDRPGVRQVPEGSGEQGKMEETGCEIICGAPTTLAVKGQMMMMMMMIVGVVVVLMRKYFSAVPLSEEKEMG